MGHSLKALFLLFLLGFSFALDLEVQSKGGSYKNDSNVYVSTKQIYSETINSTHVEHLYSFEFPAWMNIDITSDRWETETTNGVEIEDFTCHATTITSSKKQVSDCNYLIGCEDVTREVCSYSKELQCSEKLETFEDFATGGTKEEMVESCKYVLITDCEDVTRRECQYSGEDVCRSVSKDFTDYTYGKAVTSIDTSKNNDYICKAITSFGGVGSFNISYGAIKIDPDISACTVLSSPGIYLLTANITSPGSTCFSITSDDVVLDCQGNNITGDNTSGNYGVHIDDMTNVTVANCGIYMFQHGVFVTESRGVLVENNTINITSNNGIRFGGVNDSVARNNTVSANVALHFATSGGKGSDRNRIENNFMQSQGDNAISGLLLNTANHNNISGNTFIETTGVASSCGIGFRLASVNFANRIYNNNIVAVLDGIAGHQGTPVTASGSYNNTFYGNNITAAIWVNNSNASNFYNTTGIGNRYFFLNGTSSWEVYNISDNNGDVWADEGSNYPFDSSISEWIGSGNDSHPFVGVEKCFVANNAGQSFILSKDLEISGTNCINANADNVIVDCQSHTVMGDNTTNSFGIFSENHSNIEVKNCNLNSWDFAIRIRARTAGETSGANYSVHNNNITNNLRQCIFLLGDVGTSTVKNSTVYNNLCSSEQKAIQISVADNMTIFNNTFNSTAVTANVGGAVSFVSVNNSVFANNTININSGYGIAFFATIAKHLSVNNMIYNNTINSGSEAIAIWSTIPTQGNKFYLNNITSDKWVTDNSTGTANFFNTTEVGNIYNFANGTEAWEVYDITCAGGNCWATGGTDRPFDNSIAEWNGNGEDWHPWVGVSGVAHNAFINITNVTITSSEGTFANGWIAHNITAQTNDTGTLTAYISLFKDGVNITGSANSTVISNNTEQMVFNLTTLEEGSTYNFTSYVSDGTNISGINITQGITVQPSIPTIQTIVMSPDTPAVTGEIYCVINATDIINSTFTVCRSIFLDGVNQTDLEICNTSYSNATIWNTTIDLNNSNTMQSDNWSCGAYATDGVNINSNISNNVTVSHVDAKIPNLFPHITTGTGTIASATKNWINFDSFAFTEQYGANQTCLIQSTFYSSAQDDLDAKYRLQQTVPASLTATYIERSLNPNRFASIIMGDLLNISALDTYQFDLDFAKINSTSANTNISNATSFLLCMHDVNTNTSLDFNGVSFFNTTTSPTFVPVFTKTITTIDRGFRAWMWSKYQISSDSDSIVETYTAINTSTFTRNGSTDYMGLTAVTSFSDGDYAYSVEKINGGVNVTYTIYAKTTNGTATLNMTGIEFAYQTNEISQFIVDRTQNFQINTTDFSTLGPFTFSPLVSNRTLLILNAISGNATGAITNSTGKTNITDTGDDRESLITRRTFTTGKPGKIHLTPVYSNLLYSDYTYTAWGLIEPAGTSVDLIGGSRLSFATTETPTVDVNLTCGKLAVSNTNYDLSNNITTTGTCFNITAQNVVLDCNGYSITSDNSTGSFGAWIENTGATITNCTFHSFEAGIGTNSTGLTAYYNNFTTTYWMNDSGSSNYMNTTGIGNIYYFINGTASWDVYNITTNLPAPNWANNGTNYPFNATLDQWIGTSNDSAPWTTVQGNTFPVLNTIFVSPANPLNTEILQCFVNASNGESSQLNISYEWYKNGTNQTALAGSINISNDTLTNIANVSNALTAVGENWSCRARANDGIDYTAWVFSDNVTISDKWVVGILFYPYNETVFGPAQCSVIGQVNLTSSNSSDNKTTSCRLYSYSGAPGEDYELVGTNTQITTDGIQNFSFNITPSLNHSFKMNCSLTYGAINEITNTQNFSIIGQSLCFFEDGYEKEFVYEDLFENRLYSDSIALLLIFLGLWMIIQIILKPQD